MLHRVEQAEQLVRAFRGFQLGVGGHVGVAGALELRDVVILIDPLRAFAFRQEVRRASAHDHVGLHGEEVLHDVVVVGAQAVVRHHRGGRRILDLGVGDDADRHAARTLHDLRDRLDARVIEIAFAARAINAERVDAGLVTGRVGGRAVGAVGDDRVHARGRDQRHVRHVVDRKLAAVAAFDQPLGENARRRAVRDREAVADEQDHVLRLRRAGVEHLPGHTRGLVSGGGLDRVPAGVRERGVADPVGRMLKPVLALDEQRRLLAVAAAASAPLIVTRTAPCAGAPGNSTFRSNFAPARISARWSG